MKSDETSSEATLEEGRVLELDGDFAVLELETAEACGCCAARAACQVSENGKRTLRIKNTLQAEVGSLVCIKHHELNQLKLSLMNYGLPLLAFLAAVLLGNYLITTAALFSIPREIWQFAFGIIALLLIGCLTKRWNMKRAGEGFKVFEMVSWQKQP